MNGLLQVYRQEQEQEHDVSCPSHETDRSYVDFTPQSINKELGKYIIGQEQTKKILSVALYNHVKRINDRTHKIRKSNIILCGPSGSGKTHVACTLAKLLKLPFATVDATSMTQAGYVGDDVEICLQRLLYNAGGDIKLAQRGIIYIDEIDKIACKSENRSITRDVSGEGVQQGLLKIIEGSRIDVPIDERRKGNGKCVQIDTSNILFIVGGCFDGLHNDNHPPTRVVGFSNSITPEASQEEEPKIDESRLIEYGMMREFVGRFPIICQLNALTENDLVGILKDKKDSICSEYVQLFKADDIELEFAGDALHMIASLAIEKGTGARGLRSILEDILLDTFYTVPSIKNEIEKVIVTGEAIKTKTPHIIFSNREEVV